MPAAMDVLASYVPAMVRRHLVARPSADAPPESERHPAAVLLVDISGFTRLTERLAEHGESGLEELTGILNAYFDRLIERIADHGGDVAKMAGDALVAIWPASGPGESPASAALRAARCGRVIQETLGDYDCGGGIRLTSKVGIGSGEVVAMYLGGVLDRRELVLSGDPLGQVGLAERLAGPGEVIASPEAWSLIRGSSVGEALEGGFARVRSVEGPSPRPLESPVPGPEARAALTSYLPGAIRARLGAGQTEWIAELRRLTVLFVGLPPLDPGGLDAPARMQEVVAEIQGAIYRQEGSLNKIAVDEKGTILLAALGLPPLAHPDDARRGLMVARGIRDALDRLGVRPSIGVAGGRVYCGEVGNARRREYTLIGRAVNLAARLMQAAQEGGGILCDGATRRAADGCFEFEALPPRRLKNIEGEVPLFRPRGASLPCGASRPTVGRSGELAELARRLDALAEGRGGLVVIEGEPGIGKSQLVDDLLARATRRGFAALVGRGDAVERTTPHHAWRPLFTRMLGGDEGAATARLAGRPELVRLAPLLNGVLPGGLPENELTGQMSGQVRADNANELMLRLLQEAVDRGPTVLILEDAHWFDSSSWALALLAARWLDRALVVATSRGEGESGSPEEHRRLLATPGALRVRLDALPPDDVLALACRRLGVDDLPRPAADLILAKAQGNPFFSEELAFALRDAGLLVVEGRACRVAPGVDLGAASIPDRVEGVVNGRVDRLDPAERLALKVSSVIGRQFAVRILRDVHPIEGERDRLPDRLDALARLDLIVPDEPDPDPAYQFRHVVTREVVYDQMPFAQRRQLHRAVAEWYERAPDGDPSKTFPRLAHHWGRAGDDARAVEMLEKAADEALKGGAYREAVGFLTEALGRHESAGLGAGPARRAGWESRLGEAHLGLGQLAPSRLHAARALELLGKPVPGRALLPAGLAAQVALLAWRRARPGGEPAESRRLASATYGLIGQLSYFDQDRATGVYAAIRSLNLAEGAGPSPELARSLAVMCIAAGLVPVHPLAESYARRAREAAGGLDDLPSRAWVHLLTGMYDLGIGRWPGARSNLGRAVELARELGDWRRWEEASGELARLDFHEGRLAEGERRFAEVGAEARRRDHGQALAWGLHGRSMILIRLGRVAEALAHLEESMRLPPGVVGTGDAILRAGLLAEVHLARGDRGPALEAAEETLRLIRRNPPIVAYTLEGYAGAAGTFLALRERSGPGPEGARLAASARQTIAALRRLARIYPIARPRAWLLRGTARRLDGRHRAARRAWREASRLAERLAMPMEQALALREAARHLPPADPGRLDALRRADSLLEQIGARDPSA